MIRHGFIAATLAFVLGSPAAAQTAWLFSWQKGDVIVSRVEHVTAVTETIGGVPSDITSKLAITKQWRVIDVDAQGVATLEQSLLAMKNEQTRPGSKLVFDSSDLDRSTPELKPMAKFLNVVLATIRVDRVGRVVEVKSGPKGKYDAEPPFGVVLPGQPVAAGQAWVRPFTLTIDPPLGLGEKYQAEQSAKALKIEGSKATIELSTTVKNPPESANEKLPLLQKELRGQLVFDASKGRVESIRLSTDRTVENHQGAGSSYRFASTYVEQAVAPSAIVPTSGTR